MVCFEFANHGSPLVGISANIDYDKTSQQNIGENYVSAIYNAGGIPFVATVPDIGLKSSYSSIAMECARRIDGLLLSGGDDVDAQLYGEENFSFNGGFTEERDLFEIELCKSVASLKKPILGICRGIQLLNVAMGGTLFQDIHSQKDDKASLMHAQKAPPYSAVHAVKLARDSRMAGILLGPGESCGTEGDLRVMVNSFHHQAVKDVAPAFKATGHASDGLVEAIEPREPDSFLHPFTMGVQWHPERMWKYHKHALNLFAKFIEACGE
ncbi:MAG: gamma-glutamyl-gamma-aminobutyrate hydrolase family protein [Synergistaceae bacterium]|jgi:putative glutamine amidotransferase|nr:gamma-glutamyl-gamma-aminobutyrate hydrolase family protein [Synergistaceae bacterium]